MSKLFIIEGPDCSGKTSLAKAICRTRRAAYTHASGIRSLHLAMTDYHLSLLQSAIINIMGGMDVVMDRFWPSEYVYGKLLRPHVESRYDYQCISALLDPLDPIYIFCWDDMIIERHRGETDPDHPYDDSQFAAILCDYKLLYEQLDARKRHYDLLKNGTSIELPNFLDLL